MDPSSSWPYLLLYGILILFSFYFSATESAYTKANRIRVKTMADDGDKRAKKALRIIDDYENALVTILVGNNIVNIGASVVATIFAANVFNALRLAGTRVSESAAGAVATAVTTVVVLWFGEMIPKNYADENAEKVALRHASSLGVLIVILKPLAFLFSGIRLLLSRLFPQADEPSVTEEELSDIIESAEEEGGIDEEQSDLLQSALEFSKTAAANVLTLRDDMVSLMLSDSEEKIKEIILKHKYSRYPVFDGDLDHPVGILTSRRFLRDRIEGKHTPIAELLNPVFFVPLDAGIDDLLSMMSRTKSYMAIVQDKSGKTMGIVTIEDFLEELVGEIWDENDVVNENFTKLGGNRFEVSGRLSLTELFRNMSYVPKEEPASEPVQTWVLGKFGHIPEEEDSFDWEDLTVTVEEMNEHRIEKVIVKLNVPELDVEPADDESTERELEAANGELIAAAEREQSEADEAVSAAHDGETEAAQ